jgi:cell wall-associated NlpC family hydrolase
MHRQLKPLSATDDVKGMEAALADSPAVPRRPTRRRMLAAALAAVCAALVLAALSMLGGGPGARPAATAATASGAAAVPTATAVPPAQATPGSKGGPATLRSHPQIVVAVPPGQAPQPDAGTTSTATSSTARAPSDAQVRSELALFRRHLQTFSGARGPVPQVKPDGTAVAPLDAPGVVATVIAAGNAIATTPYKWGGGHGAWADTGYDCSGSISFALAGAGLLQSPLVAAQFMRWGDVGPGRWITIYANSGHTFMVVAGLRFDTSGAQAGTRWQPANGRSYAGFTQRHPPGL